MAYIKSVTSTDNTTYDIKSKVTNGIPYGECDSTSTATAFTATVEGLDALYDGACVMLKNGVVTSAANFTINVNNLGAKPCYNNMATGNDITPTAPTRDTTIFNINYTMLFIYSEDIVDGGGWICYRGYDGNTNTIGYQLRTNSSNLVAADTGYRYRIWLTSADGKKWVPINTSTSTNATTARTLNTRAIDPFGAIVYRATNGTCNSGAGIGATGIWQQYTLTIGYSYVLTLTFPAPVYLRCTPQTNGSAVMNDVVQTLPSTNDGKIYIFLGVAYSASSMELQAYHPVYWHDGTGIRIWTGAASSGSSVDPATATPLMDGTAAVGTSAKYAREDHVHPSDTNKVNTIYSSGTISNMIDSNEYGVYAITSDSSANTSGTVGTSAIGAYLTASNASGIYTLEATTTGFGATYIDGTTFETETIFDFTAMTEQEIASAVEAGWPTLYAITTNSPETAYDAFDSDNNTLGSQITEAKEGDTVYVLAEAAKQTRYTLYVKDSATGTTITTGTFVKTISMSLGCVFSFVMPAANVTISILMSMSPGV